MFSLAAGPAAPRPPSPGGRRALSDGPASDGGVDRGKGKGAGERGVAGRGASGGGKAEAGDKGEEAPTVAAGRRRPGRRPQDRLARAWTATKEGTAHAFWWLVHGMRDMGYDIRLALSLIAKRTRGRKLTRSEEKILSRTSKDVFKIFPMIPFVVIPAAEFLLPVVLKVFPSMLPTQFSDLTKQEQTEEQRALEQLEGSRSLLNSLSRLAQKKAAPGKGGEPGDPDMAAFAVFLDRILLGRQIVHTEEICRLAPLFEDRLALVKMPREALGYLGRMWAIPTTNGNTEYMCAQLEEELIKLRKDDRAIRRDGIESMTNKELREACRNRNIRSFDLDSGTLREYLNDWLCLTLDREVPPSLVLVSRAFMISSKGFMPVSRRWKSTRTYPDPKESAPLRRRKLPDEALVRRPRHMCPTANFDPYEKLLLVCALAGRVSELAQGGVPPGKAAAEGPEGFASVAGKDVAEAATSLGASGSDVKLLLAIVAPSEGDPVHLVDLLNLSHPQFPEALAFHHAMDPDAWPLAFREWGMADWSERPKFCHHVRQYLERARSPEYGPDLFKQDQ